MCVCIHMYIYIMYTWSFPSGSVVRHLPAMQEMLDLTPGLGRSLGGGNGNPLQYLCYGQRRLAKTPLFCGVAKSRTLSN